MLLVGVYDSPDVAPSVCVVCSSETSSCTCIDAAPYHEFLRSHTNPVSIITQTSVENFGAVHTQEPFTRLYVVELGHRTHLPSLFLSVQPHGVCRLIEMCMLLGMFMAKIGVVMVAHHNLCIIVLAWEGVLRLMLYWSRDHPSHVRLLAQHDPAMLGLIG